MSEMELVRVLLVEDDEDDYILTRGLFSDMKGRRFQPGVVQVISANGLEAHGPQSARRLPD